MQTFLINILVILISFTFLHVVLFGSVYLFYILTEYFVNMDILLILIVTAELHVAHTIIFKRRIK